MRPEWPRFPSLSVTQLAPKLTASGTSAKLSGQRAGFASWPLLLGLLGVILLVPFLFSPGARRSSADPAHTLIVISPHNEAIRHEISRAFSAYHLRATGQPAEIDWRTPGGTSEITRYLESVFLANFQEYWTHELHRPWSSAVERSFASGKVQPAASPAKETPEQQARRAFLDSKVGCGIDLFFGGGAFDFIQQAGAGRLVDSGVVRAHPELFNPQDIPQIVGGEPYWDKEGRWIGACLSAFGICYNTDSLSRLGIHDRPKRWADLEDPRYFHEIALANPTQSGSINKAFEMLIQQQMLERYESARKSAPDGKLTPEQETVAIRAGWAQAMQMLMRIGANARYYSDASTKIVLDVAAGEAAAGMTIDFYGRFESEEVAPSKNPARGSGDVMGSPRSRLYYVNAEGGTSFGADPVGELRGAPHPELARRFIEWILTPEAQKLWNWKVGAPGGPERYALRRLPILPSLYAPEYAAHRSDPEINPYHPSAAFTYHDRWTGPLFRPIAFIVRVMCIDPHDELVGAWHALIEAHFPPKAMAAFSDVSAIDYATASGRIRETLSSTKIREVQLAKELADHFREQYRQAEMLAKRGE